MHIFCGETKAQFEPWEADDTFQEVLVGFILKQWRYTPEI